MESEKTTDIVVRLRAAHHSRQMDTRLPAQAADEIERLRAEVDRLQGRLDDIESAAEDRRFD